MRTLALVCITAVACGDNLSVKSHDAPPQPVDVLPPSDVATDVSSIQVDAGLPPCANPVSGSNISFRRLNATSLGAPATLATSPPLDPRLFVLTLDGKIWLFKDEVLVPTPFLDLSAAAGGPVSVTGEQGLLGLAFHPKYATNGLFYIYYTTSQVPTLRDVIARCAVSTNPDQADPTTCTEIFSVADPAQNHNGGMMEFGSDGYLYIATGDGGGVEHNGRARDLTGTFGKMLRIDVDHPANGKLYGIPPDNPFTGGSDAPEIWMYGMRNPWRWSFDKLTGDMWIADVGASTVEELDVLAPSEQKGADLGWDMYEGSDCFGPPCDPTGKVFPKEVQLHADNWIAIIGGEVYRGSCYPDLYGYYFYTDLANGEYIKSQLQPDRSLVSVQVQSPVALPHGVTSIHADSRGELYITTFPGYVQHLEAAP